MKKKEKKISENKDLMKKVKEMLELAKNKNLIKSHVLAFNDNPVETEHHKGKVSKVL